MSNAFARTQFPPALPKKLQALLRLGIAESISVVYTPMGVATQVKLAAHLPQRGGQEAKLPGFVPGDIVPVSSALAMKAALLEPTEAEKVGAFTKRVLRRLGVVLEPAHRADLAATQAWLATRTPRERRILAMSQKLFLEHSAEEADDGAAPAAPGP